MSHSIKIYEWDRLYVNASYDGVIFQQKHLDALHRYKVQNEKANYYEPLYNQVRFNNYVGIIKIGNLTLEVLPKPDRHEDDKALWQNVLLNMLLISLQIEAKTSTSTNISVRQHSVLETYLQLFLNEVEKLIHQGLVKKYRNQVSNQTSLSGKLLIHQQVIKNAVHAERFFVAHSKYEQDNIFNSILETALRCVVKIGNESSRKAAESNLIYFPECTSRKLDERLFERLTYDRKTAGYRMAIDLARIIILNYHPDIKGGKNDILAIMFDMNLLWEKFIYWSLRKAAINKFSPLIIREQVAKSFWRGKNRTISLRPDILITNSEKENIVIDTKWKYRRQASVEDIRQLYVYGQYYSSERNYLLYPDQVDNYMYVEEGVYFNPEQDTSRSSQNCGLIFIDVIKNGALNRDIGTIILQKLDSCR